MDLDVLPYPVVIGTGLWPRVAEFVEARGFTHTVVVCDERVAPYAQAIAATLPASPAVLPFALGERRKHLRTVEKVLDALADAGADRRTLLIGAGGGVAGDLFGYVAASYMRGIGFVNVATSVVAMVDASIGGKTGVDLRAGKNLAGAFADPAAVFAAIDTLTTLPERQMREGIGEIVKHAVINGETTFARLEALTATPLRSWPWEEIVAESMHIKAGVVSGDRLEAGRRELLNLGHTFAHGIEFASAYRISHGAAVAIGIRAAGLLGMRLECFSPAAHARTLRLLQALRLPLFTAEVNVDDVMLGMTADKKARGGTLRFVVPRAIGDVDFGIAVPAGDARDVVAKILVPPSGSELGA